MLKNVFGLFTNKRNITETIHTELMYQKDFLNFHVNVIDENWHSLPLHGLDKIIETLVIFECVFI